MPNRRQLLATAALFFAPVAASAATIPFAETFQDGAAQGFTVGGVGNPSTNTFNVVEQGGAGSGDFVYQHSIAGSAVSGLSSVQITDLGPATPNTAFTVSELIRVQQTATGGYGYGIRLLGLTDTSNNDSYIADISNTGQVRIVEFTGATTSITTGGTLPGFATSKAYQLALTGTYNGAGALTLALLVTDVAAPANTAAATLANDPTPRTGQFFGFRDNVGTGTTGTLIVNHDNFTVAAVPEPASAALLGLAAVPLLARRRRAAR